MEGTLSHAGTLMMQVAMGVSLAACAGLRAFLPLLVVGVAGRLELVPLSSSFEWLAATPALVVFGVAVAAELLADKFPVVDNFLDALQGFVKPIAGTLLVAAVVEELTPLQSSVLGLIAGGTTAGAVHLAKAKTRLVSSVTTAGLGNPVLSVAEDAASLTGSVVALVAPLLALGFLILFALLVALAVRRLRRGLARRPAHA